MQEVHLQDVSGRAESGTEAESNAGAVAEERRKAIFATPFCQVRLRAYLTYA